MSKLDSPYKCNYCGKIKTALNHWFLRMASLQRSGFILQSWEDEHADDNGVEHICGNECAQKALAKWLETAG